MYIIGQRFDTMWEPLKSSISDAKQEDGKRGTPRRWKRQEEGEKERSKEERYILLGRAGGGLVRL